MNLSLSLPVSEERLLPKTVFSELKIHYTTLVTDTNTASHMLIKL